MAQTACTNGAIQVESSAAGSVQWDFCAGDLYSTPSSSIVLNNSSFLRSRSLQLVNENGSWYGFAISTTDNTLLRMFFGDDLTNTPVFTNLGSLSGAFSSVYAFDMIEYNGVPYIFAANSGNSTIVRLAFVNGLNDLPDVLNLGNFGLLSSANSISVEEDNGNYYGFVSSNTSIVRLSFGTNLLNLTPTISSYPVSGSSSLRGLDLIKDCSSWYGILLSYGNFKIYSLSFSGGSLGGTPVFTELPTAVTTRFPATIKLVNEGGKFFGFIQSAEGNLYRITFGDHISDFVYNTEDLGKLTLSSQNFALDIQNIDSKWYAFNIDLLNRNLASHSFNNTCSASITTSESQSESISYSQAGQYVVSLRTIENEAISYHRDTIMISSAVAPDIDFTSQNICLSSPVNFSSINASGNIVSYNWDFGDGNSSTAAAPNHTYASAGSYMVTLAVSSSDGCENFAKKGITIYPEPTPSFNFPSSTICTNDTYVFENTTPGSYNGNISYEWFVNGASVSTAENLNYEFLTGGAKEIKLVATIPGCSAEVIQTISDVSIGPVAQFTVNDDCVGKALQFNNTSTGDITSVHWDFGNGFTSNLENPLFQYATPGTYNVTLTLTNSAGCETSKIQEVNVYELPDVQFTNELSCEGISTVFTDETTVGDANLASWNWDFDDPTSGSNISADRHPTHVFTTSGAFDVKLVVQTTNGCKDSLQQVVNVKPAPEAGFEYDKLCINEPIQFMDASVPVPNEDITDWSWDLGGIYSAVQNPERTFEFALDYSVGLTVTSENLCTSTIYKTVSVKPEPTVIFGVEMACDNADAHFFDTTDPMGDSIISRSWDFDGLATSIDSSSYYAFNQTGNYNVGLTIMTENGCDYSITQSIQINAAPTAEFEPSVTFGAPPLEVEFTNRSEGANSFQWTFEEGNTSGSTNAVYTFTEENSYDVKLVATDENGCNDTITHRINVLYPDLDILFTALNRNPVDETEVILTVGNNGTVTIDSFKTFIDLGNQATIEKVISQTLNPRTSAEAPLQFVNINLGFNIDPRSLDYLCVTLVPLFEGLEESEISNNTKCINLNNDETVILAPFPNPASNQLYLQIISEKVNSATVQLFDTKGDLIKSIDFNELPAGMSNIHINTADINSGIYVLRAYAGGKTAMYKVIVDN
ncbi:PKD domain-containing protein [Fulvivirga sp. 29W222]|uniref:PKD domain-containing protein n=2 Tax=Fulvivirga marina TaxID=2494733 RepID=A0A937FY19_9BACT|nr:PKD domain-containing protein [Fulvivirga marina]